MVASIRRAYPRSHGATMSEVVKAMPPQGLSPLARGNLAVAVLAAAILGPIPARTGQPLGTKKPPEGGGAYPRSHGATSCVVPASFTNKGLSPLARGNLRNPGAAGSGFGPIPARTGQPGIRKLCHKCLRAYPRSHGATGMFCQ